MVNASKVLMHSLCEFVYGEYKRNDNRVPHKLFQSLVVKNKDNFPKLNESRLRTAFNRFKAKKEKELSKDASIPLISIGTDDAIESSAPIATNDKDGEPVVVTPREKGGRPTGTTIAEQYLL